MSLHTSIRALVFCLTWITIWDTAPCSAGPSKPSLLCLVEHCGGQTIACMEDTDCKASLECVSKCGMSNESCLNICLNTYEDPVYDDLMKCMVYDHDCFTPEPPNPSFRCNPPKTVVKDFSLSQLNGTWYNVRGLSRDLDCFDCFLAQFAPSEVSQNYTINETFDVAMTNGSARGRLVVQNVQQKYPDVAVFDYTSQMMGLNMYERWQVLAYSTYGRYVVFYYCGHVNSHWWYEGSVVFSRSPVLAPVDVPDVAYAIKTTYPGHSLDQYCSPKTGPQCK